MTWTEITSLLVKKAGELEKLFSGMGVISSGLFLSASGRRLFLGTGQFLVLGDEILRHPIVCDGSLAFSVMVGTAGADLQNELNRVPTTICASGDNVRLLADHEVRVDLLAIAPAEETKKWFLLLGASSGEDEIGVHALIPTPKIPSEFRGKMFPFARIVSQRGQKECLLEPLAPRLGT